MAEHTQIGRTDQATNPQVRKESAAESIQRDPYAAQTAAEQTAAETGAEQEGLESMPSEVTPGQSRLGNIENVASQAASGARNAVSGTLNSVGSVGDEVIGVARDVLKGAIAATEEVGTGLIGGAQHVAKDVLHGVGDVGGTAVHTLTNLLVGIVGGVKTVVAEAMPRRATESQAGSGVVERKRTEEAEGVGRPARAERRPSEETMH